MPKPVAQPPRDYEEVEIETAEGEEEDLRLVVKVLQQKIRKMEEEKGKEKNEREEAKKK